MQKTLIGNSYHMSSKKKTYFLLLDYARLLIAARDNLIARWSSWSTNWKCLLGIVLR